jgi:hypothetical protein
MHPAAAVVDFKCRVAALATLKESAAILRFKGTSTTTNGKYCATIWTEITFYELSRLL